MLVDEATSEVDVACEEKMRAVMAEVFAECTVLTIAHRVSTMGEAEVVMRMSEGALTVDE